MNRRIDTARTWMEAPPDRIYQAFLDQEELVKWLPPEGMSARATVFEPWIGGTYQLVLTYEEIDFASGKTTDRTDVSNGRFLDLVPGLKIVQVGTFESTDPDFAGEMTQTWYLEALDGGTRITIVCENVPPGIQKQNHDTGLRSTLDNLARYLTND
ncbi:SRPBCC domain-containing protein [Exiguobacterium aurantiacum]|uniref:SRPBCC domain-containing protein n=1 Tax=Exiguobacterium aurantiacum TaxID=33987 RepID=A0ABY5FJC4_9BACL|nr:SRPBCC domain-containing protein [Exiguobacterium aurantiacum]UTT41581.1 SRPBCC domain-containing protein [Exiguobacterium aurantiacum]